MKHLRKPVGAFWCGIVCVFILCSGAGSAFAAEATSTTPPGKTIRVSPEAIRQFNKGLYEIEGGPIVGVRKQLNTMRRANRSFTLVLLYESSCPHCRHFASVLRQFAEINRVCVTAMTVDGRALPEYPHTREASPKLVNLLFGNHLFIDDSNVPPPHVYPALFFIDPLTGNAAQVLTGDVSYDELAINAVFWAERLMLYERENPVQPEDDGQPIRCTFGPPAW